MITYRRLLITEKDKVEEHLKRLDTANRVMRFETAATDSFIERYVAGLKRPQDILLGAFDDTLTLRGFAHVAVIKDLADLGLSVEASFRGHGIGSHLLDKAIEAARNRRTKTFSSQCLTHNRWMMGKMRAMGCHIERDYETAVATAELPPPDAISMTKAVFDEQLGWLDYNTKLVFSLLPFGQRPA